MVQDRPYRKGMDFVEAAEEVVRHAGTQFDPLVVTAFIKIRGEVRNWLEGRKEEQKQ